MLPLNDDNGKQIDPLRLSPYLSPSLCLCLYQIHCLSTLFWLAQKQTLSLSSNPDPGVENAREPGSIEAIMLS